MRTWQKLKANPKLWSQYFVREEVFNTIRTFFSQQGFHEVETPLLVERASTETYLEFFETKLTRANGQQKTGYLTTSPEYAMKKLLVAGLPKLFQICKSFRNGEGTSSRHNPEFTILEWYRADADYNVIMADCEALFRELVRKIKKEKEFSYQGKKYNISKNFIRLSVAEAFEKYAQISADQLVSPVGLLARYQEKGYQRTTETDWEAAYNQIFLNEIEPKLAEFDQPVFLYDYPVQQAALSRVKTSDPRFAERFEWYLGGIELGNAFSELTDAAEQEQRLRQDVAFRKATGRNNAAIDEDFIDALKAGMPEAGGIAVGVDRLVMLLADTSTIHETQFFPADEAFS